MPTKLSNWLESRRKRKKQLQYNNGFDFAAGALLRREHTPISLEALYIGSNMDQFDLGTDAAIDIIVGLNFVEDDRTWAV